MPFSILELIWSALDEQLKRYSHCNKLSADIQNEFLDSSLTFPAKWVRLYRNLWKGKMARIIALKLVIIQWDK